MPFLSIASVGVVLAVALSCTTRPVNVVIVATGRSGSTTIMSMLNLVPGVYIAGENAGAAAILSDLYKAAQTTKQHKGREGPWKHKPIDAFKLECDMRQYLFDVIGSPAEPIVGFKTIRVHTYAEIDFLAKHLIAPDSLILINYRKNVEQQRHSTWWKSDSEGKLDRITAALGKWRKDNRKNPNVIDAALENFSVEMFNDVLDKLNITDCRFRFVLHDNRNSSYIKHDTKDAIECLKPKSA